MEYEKPWFESKSIWGALISILAFLSLLVGNLSTEMEPIVILAGATGALYAIYGRLSATEFIS